jgi:pSer/pThr/pTyr-binding forkhead associated (FHA) protein
MTPLLLVVAGPDKGRSFPLPAGQTLQIGRSQSTATRLTDPTVSRVHCEVEWDGRQAVILNISSSGTLLNGQSISHQVLKHGDVIRLGSTDLSFQLSAPDATTAPPAPAAAPAKPFVAGPGAVLALAGQRLSRFQLGELVAKGASSGVFKALDTEKNQEVALKVMQPEFTQSEEDMQRFVRAMKTVAPLQHPNLVRLLGAGKSGVFCWVAMEYIDGESMKQVINRIGVAGMLDWRYGYRVGVHIARGLDYAHSQGIIHRNVTPTNILLRTSDKQALLGDLMLAKALEGSKSKPITRPGELVGDVTYMSPERTRGDGEVDGRSDLYSLGATVYALVTGRPPFKAGTIQETIQQIRTVEPEKPAKYQLAVPGLFQGVVMKLLAKRPEERFQTARDLVVELERVGKFSGVTA